MDSLNKLCLSILMLLYLFTSFVLASTARYPFESPAQQAQFQALLHDLRCPVCQNQDLADSHAALAEDLRTEVYERVRAQQSDQEIIQHLMARYGDFIIFNPPVKGLTALLWFGPACMLIIGFGLFIKIGRRKS